MPAKIGDRVTVTWGYAESCEWMVLKGYVTHVPNGTGDLWWVRDDDGNEHGINSGCVTFEAIVVAAQEGE